MLWEKLAWLELVVFVPLTLFPQLDGKLVKGGIGVLLIFVINVCTLGKGATWLTQVYNLLPVIPKCQSSANGKMFLNLFGNKIWPQWRLCIYSLFMDVYLFHCRMLMCLIMGCCPDSPEGIAYFNTLLHTHTCTHTHTGYPKTVVNCETHLTPGLQGRYCRAVFIDVPLEDLRKLRSWGLW